MTRVFLDTSFYIALLSEKDELHEKAVALAGSVRNGAVTTEYVLIEVGNWLAQTGNKQPFREFLAMLEQDERTLIVPCSSCLFMQAVEQYTNRLDREWTLSDCISFVVMQREEITQVLTSNHRFRQAGFDVLLNSAS